MEDNTNFVEETTENTEELSAEEIVEGNTESTENVENVEETPVKKYTEEEFNSRLDELLAKKIARKEEKIRREYENKYKDYRETEAVLNAGLGTSSIQEANENLRKYYEEKGITIPKEVYHYDEYDMKAGAEKEASEIIDSGYDEIVEEVDRLANERSKGELSNREEIIFQKLCEKRKELEEEKEIESIGVKREEITKAEVQDYFKKLNSNLSLKEKWDMYVEHKPKETNEIIGSMNQTIPNVTKDYYTPEEAARLTSEDLDKPEIWDAVMESMKKWNK